MTTPIPIRPVSLESIQAELRGLREDLAQVVIPVRQQMWELPSRVPRAVVAPHKYTSTIPEVLFLALKRFADYRRENINLVVSEALRAYIPTEHLDAALQDMMAEQRRWWSEEVSSDVEE